MTADAIDRCRRPARALWPKLPRPALPFAVLLCLVSTGPLLPPRPAAAAPAHGDIRLADVDTLSFADHDLRGLAWLAPDTCVALLALPDSLPRLPAREVSLLWLTAAGDTLRREDFTGTLDRGLVYDGKYLWSLGDFRPDRPATLYKIEADTLFIEAAYTTPGHRPLDIAFDGEDIWLVDRDRGRLDKFSVDKEEIVRSYVTPGFSPTGVAFDGSFFWVTDKGTGRTYRLSRSGRSWTGTVDIVSYFQRGREMALAWDGADLWRFGADDSLAVRMAPP